MNKIELTENEKRDLLKYISEAFTQLYDTLKKNRWAHIHSQAI